MIESKNKLYDVVFELCKKNNVSVSKMCADTGLKTQMFTELKSGRTRTMSLDTVGALTRYFKVSADVFILNDEG